MKQTDPMTPPILDVPFFYTEGRRLAGLKDEALAAAQSAKVEMEKAFKCSDRADRAHDAARDAMVAAFVDVNSDQTRVEQAIAAVSSTFAVKESANEALRKWEGEYEKANAEFKAACDSCHQHANRVLELALRRESSDSGSVSESISDAVGRISDAMPSMEEAGERLARFAAAGRQSVDEIASVARSYFADLRAAHTRPVAKVASLDLSELREKNVARCNDVFHPLNDWSPSDWSNAVCGEAGELANLVKKARRGDFNFRPYTEEHIYHDFLERVAMEAADVLIYLDLLCARMGVSLSDAVIAKFNAVSEAKGSDLKL